MSALFSPLEMRGLVLGNRIVVSPMCQYSAHDGVANDWHAVHLGGLALSGAGMLILESTAVEPIGRITSGDLGLWDAGTENALRHILSNIRARSSIAVAIQLGHAGRKGSSAEPWKGGQQVPITAGGWQTVAPSEVAQLDHELAPSALDGRGMARIVAAFAEAAFRADRLGFDAIEIHGGHGYLIHQFLSPISNRRADGYGGTLENRMRLPLEIFDAVRAAVDASKPVGMKVSATDWVEGGLSLEETVVFGSRLRERGVDWVTTSSGGISPKQSIPIRPGYQVPFSASVRREAGTRTIAVGMITEPEQAERVIAAGDADLVAIARGMLYDPRWGWHAAAALGATVPAPPQYWRAAPGDLRIFRDTSFGSR